MNTHDMRGHVGVFNEIRDRIATLYGLTDDDEFLLGTVDGETDMQGTICRVLREAIATEHMADGLDTLIKANKERKTRFDQKAERLRAIASWAMQETGLTKVTAPDLTASTRMGKAKFVIDDDQLSDTYLVPVTTFKPDRDAIQSAFDETGALPAGVTWSNPAPVLTVRVR